MKTGGRGEFGESVLQFSWAVPLRMVMATTLLIACGAYMLALTVLIIEMAAAPAGYQDEAGFHCGEEPVSEMGPSAEEAAPPEALRSQHGR